MPASAASCTASATRSSAVGAQRDVQGGRRDARPQALDDGVAAEHGLGTSSSAAALARAMPDPVGALSPRASRPPPIRRCAGCPCAPRRAASGPCPAARACAGRRSRRPCPSSCRPCASRRGAGSCRPSVPLRSCALATRCGPSGGVLERIPGGGEPVADARRLRRSPCRPRVLPLGEQLRRPAASSASPRAVVGRGRRPNARRAGRGRGRRAWRGPHRPVAGAASRSPASSAALPSRTAACTAASACGTAQVVVDRGGEVRRHRRRASGDADPLGRTRAHERLDAPVGDRGLVERLVGVLDHRAVVRPRRGSSAARPAAHPLEQRRDESALPSDLRHLLPAQRDPGRCASSNRAKPSPAALRLGELVLVVREDQVDAAAVDVELRRRGRRSPSPSTPGASPAGPGPTASATTARRAWRPSTA